MKRTGKSDLSNNAAALAALADRDQTARLERLVSLMKSPPFSEMRTDDVLALIAGASEVHFKAGEVIISPESGAIGVIYIITQGEVSGHKGIADLSSTGFHYESGDMFPVVAAMAHRPITATYTAASPTTCLAVPLAEAERVARQSPVLANFLAGKTLQLLELSRRSTQAVYMAQALTESSLDRKLATLVRQQPVTCPPSATIEEALRAMLQHQVGAVIVCRAEGAVEGIFTRKDVLSRVTLPQVPLSAQVNTVMTRNVQVLSVDSTAEEAALLMSRFGIRHIPVIDNGRLVGVVSERDLFAIQRLSLKQVSSAVKTAKDVDELQIAAQNLRVFARTLLSQGVQAKQLTELISHLNDVLTERLLEIAAQQHGVSMDAMCWLSFGSEGRSEQTIATDQDNGLIFVSANPAQDRPRWLAFGKTVNEALDRCGYPLCKGNVMASNPACCLTLDEWKQRFDTWIERGTPEDLLNANIYFDFRGLAGRLDLASALRDFVTARAKDVTRFHKMLADDILRRSVPLNWFGAIETEKVGKQEVVDLKLRGTAIFVDVARLLSLACGIAETNTRRRFEAIARHRGLKSQRGETWSSAFEFLQMLRLRVQLDGPESPGWVAGHPNKLELSALTDIDRRLLKETFRVAHELQQRVELDYAR
ncbi:MAG TPA: DUF294 nucleotidyltransferase-like domain-containing protein [Noviherbaspirillum sp.]